VRDDHDLNELTTLEQFEIADAWTGRAELYSFTTLDLFMRSMLMKLDQGERKLPIDLGHVGKMTRRVEIETAKPMPVTPWRRSVSGSALSFDTEVRVLTKKKFELVQTLDVRAWTLPASEAQVYRDVIAELEKSDLDLMRAVRNGKFTREIKSANQSGFWGFLSWAIIGALVLYWLWRTGAG
jgi:hypothetical protein